MESIKITHITPDYLPVRGGAEVYLKHLYAILENAGYKQDIIQIEAKANTDNVIELSRFPGPLGKNRGFALWYFQYSLMKSCFRIAKSDLLIIHYPFYYLSVPWHPKTIILSHDVEWAQPPQRLTHKLRKKIASFAYHHSTGVVSNDTNFFREMGVNQSPGENYFQELERRRWFIPNCVDWSRFRDVPPVDFLKGKEVILVARNASRARGNHLSIEAFAQFNKVFPDTYLVFVGNFPSPDYYRELVQIIRNNQLSKKVFFLGNIEWKEMPSFYASAQMSLVPTLSTEGTSLSALECMASGIATITTNVGGLADLPAIKTNPTAEVMAEAMIKHYPNRKELGKQQQQIVQDNFNMDLWGKAWLTAVRTTLETK